MVIMNEAITAIVLLDSYSNTTDSSPTRTNTDNSFHTSLIFQFKHFFFYIHGYLSLTVCIFGIVTNILNIIVLTRKEMISATTNILTGLAVSDMLVMIDYIPFAIHHYIRVNQARKDIFSYKWSMFTLFHAHFSVVGHSISTWLTVTLAVWRYIVVKFPTQSRNWCTLSTARWTIIAIYICVPIIYLPVYFSFTIKLINDDDHFVYYQIDWSDFALHNQRFKQINFWVFSVGTKLGPSILLTCLSCALIKALIKAEKRKRRLKENSFNLVQVTSHLPANGLRTRGNKNDESGIKKIGSLNNQNQSALTTRMLLGILMLFLITEFPAGMLIFLSGILGDWFFQDVYSPLGELIDILALINSAINFILYCTMSKQFRCTFAKLFLS